MTCARPRFVCVLALLGFAAARFEEHCLAKTPGCRIAQVMKKTYQKSIQRFKLFFHVFTKKTETGTMEQRCSLFKNFVPRASPRRNAKKRPRGTMEQTLNY